MGLLSQLLKHVHSASNEAADSARDADIKADVTLCAPVTGTLLPLEEVPDIVISEKVMGEGVAVVPESETIVAPCDGVISRLLPTNNAFAVRMPDGLEIYVTFYTGRERPGTEPVWWKISKEVWYGEMKEQLPDFVRISPGNLMLLKTKEGRNMENPQKMLDI